MFRGEYQHGLDAKGRLILPARIREELGTQFIITKGFDGCLNIYTLEGWDNFQNKLSALPSSSKEARRISRFFIGSSKDCEVDKQGRFLIPATLRSHAHIEKNVTILGMTDHVEVWSTEEYEAYLEESEGSIEEIAGQLNF